MDNLKIFNYLIALFYTRVHFDCVIIYMHVMGYGKTEHQVSKIQDYTVGTPGQ